jgi:glycosyltransferase involved in cell wall biosynthesis
MPFFSIIIPCYNQAKWLGDSIGSIIRQDFADWEIIIVNDGSTDNTAEVAALYSKSDQRIRLINQENGGLSSARNTGILNAKGLWLDFLDADDYFLPGCLKSIRDKIENTSAQIVQTGYQLVDETKNLIANKKLNAVDGPVIDIVLRGNLGPCQSIFIRKDFVSQLGIFDTSLKSAEDWDFWLRAGKAGAERVIIHEPQVAYRQLHNSMSRNPWVMYENTLKVVERRKRKDPRISGSSALNEDIDMDDRPAIKHRLIQCVGLSVMQGKIKEALDYFETESAKYHLQYAPADFGAMNSFLSFRHWYRKEDVERVLRTYPRFYRDFFAQTRFSKQFQRLALESVFEFHRKNHNVSKFGIAGKLGNKIYDLKSRLFTQTSEAGY